MSGKQRRRKPRVRTHPPKIDHSTSRLSRASTLPPPLFFTREQLTSVWTRSRGTTIRSHSLPLSSVAVNFWKDPSAAIYRLAMTQISYSLQGSTTILRDQYDVVLFCHDEKHDSEYLFGYSSFFQFLGDGLYCPSFPEYHAERISEFVREDVFCIHLVVVGKYAHPPKEGRLFAPIAAISFTPSEDLGTIIHYVCTSSSPYDPSIWGNNTHVDGSLCSHHDPFRPNKNKSGFGLATLLILSAQKISIELLEFPPEMYVNLNVELDDDQRYHRHLNVLSFFRSHLFFRPLSYHMRYLNEDKFSHADQATEALLRENYDNPPTDQRKTSRLDLPVFHWHVSSSIPLSELLLCIVGPSLKTQQEIASVCRRAFLPPSIKTNFSEEKKGSFQYDLRESLVSYVYNHFRNNAPESSKIMQIDSSLCDTEYVRRGKYDQYFDKTDFPLSQGKPVSSPKGTQPEDTQNVYASLEMMDVLLRPHNTITQDPCLVLFSKKDNYIFPSDRFFANFSNCMYYDSSHLHKLRFACGYAMKAFSRMSASDFYNLEEKESIDVTHARHLPFMTRLIAKSGDKAFTLLPTSDGIVNLYEKNPLNASMEEEWNIIVCPILNLLADELLIMRGLVDPEMLVYLIGCLCQCSIWNLQGISLSSSQLSSPTTTFVQYRLEYEVLFGWDSMDRKECFQCIFPTESSDEFWDVNIVFVDKMFDQEYYSVIPNVPFYAWCDYSQVVALRSKDNSLPDVILPWSVARTRRIANSHVTASDLALEANRSYPINSCNFDVKSDVELYAKHTLGESTSEVHKGSRMVSELFYHDMLQSNGAPRGKITESPLPNPEELSQLDSILKTLLPLMQGITLEPLTTALEPFTSDVHTSSTENVELVQSTDATRSPLVNIGNLQENSEANLEVINLAVASNNVSPVLPRSNNNTVLRFPFPLSEENKRAAVDGLTLLTKMLSTDVSVDCNCDVCNRIRDNVDVRSSCDCQPCSKIRKQRNRVIVDQRDLLSFEEGTWFDDTVVNLWIQWYVLVSFLVFQY
jgi:hypothetical protein